MHGSYLVVRRYPYEEPFHMQLEFSVSNGLFSGTTDIYCNVGDLKEIGNRLKSFPTRLGDEFRYEYGSEDPARRHYRYFLLRAYTIDNAGHCALQVKMNNNTREPHEGTCTLSIKAEAAALNRLGSLFLTFSQLEHLEFHWNLEDQELFEYHESP
ncbi:MAG TPA: hypothetical protein VH325_11640 [Bryobacteraceae bacterium]|jgi:hypothetical protein|nr:hypothetical protein [Bryobacteraceae bacterium]